MILIICVNQLKKKKKKLFKKFKYHLLFFKFYFIILDISKSLGTFISIYKKKAHLCVIIVIIKSRLQ